MDSTSDREVCVRGSGTSPKISTAFSSEHFLQSRPALHTIPLTVTESLRKRGVDAYGAEAPIFGWLERGGEVRAAFFRTPPRRLVLTPLTTDEADALAAHLASLGHPLPGVNADHDTATAFAEAWQRHMRATPLLHERAPLEITGLVLQPRADATPACGTGADLGSPSWHTPSRRDALPE